MKRFLEVWRVINTQLFMKTLLVLLLSVSLAFAGGDEKKKAAAKETSLGRCSAGANCRACSNCSACKNCSENGGSCSVCKPELYNPKPKAEKAKPKQTADTVKTKKAKK